ncbi:hypothetical protein DPMN_157187 [Dreissena polymorpha]|uniref:Uncharacterized protein n=1 Tax=Dreissena polymorpha TaxID=45954 RepID=A0A9D4EJV5_DREPO|nr:hypothetical protein DPMN_157187 [Dreissena polymorpha]
MQRGKHVTDLGQVLFCGSESGTILQLDGEGKKKLATLAIRNDGPLSVFYNRSTASILVGDIAGKILVIKVK